eukprot:1470205-Prymnesium_polylepis.1
MRYATTGSRRSIPFVAKADDDAFFDAGWLAEQFALLAPLRQVVYGPVNVWYMWEPHSMLPVCWAADLARWRQARKAQREARRTKAAPKWDECTSESAVGPYPYPGGAFHAYSQDLAQLLVPLLDAAEQHVLHRRGIVPLLDPLSGTHVPAGSHAHPGRKLLVEDAHYGYLQTRALRELNVTMVDASMCNLAGADKRHRFTGAQICGGSLFRRELKLSSSAAPGMYTAELYHNIKHPARWQFVRSSAALLRPRPKRHLVCGASNEASLMPRRLQMSLGCCQGWRLCGFSEEPYRVSRARSLWSSG